MGKIAKFIAAAVGAAGTVSATLAGLSEAVQMAVPILTALLVYVVPNAPASK